MNIAILGGAFDPVHIGHIAICQSAFQMLPIEQFLFVPSYNHPFKGQSSLYSFATRCQFLNLAIQDINLPNKNILVCDIEKENPKENYTYQTLQKLHKIYPNNQFYFLIGTDNLASIHLWKNLSTILELATIIPIQRKGFSTNEIFDQIEQKLPINIQSKLKENLLTLNLPEVSSSHIKSLLLNNQNISHFLPPSIQKIISTKSS